MPTLKSTGNNDIGVLGLGTMGQNLSLNFADHGLSVAMYERESGVAQAFQKEHGGKFPLSAAVNLDEFLHKLKQPRVVFIMIKAGPPVDSVLESLWSANWLQRGDVIIDGGNSEFMDTRRRVESARSRGVLYVGCGVSGGAHGARFGPSLMPGGNDAAWPVVRPMLEPIAAKAFDGSPCCTWMGPGGAGHYVKTLHNGIEYGVMQLIAEVFDVMRKGLGMRAGEIAEVFEKWNAGILHSYLAEITGVVLRAKDAATGSALVDMVLDVAGQKGTGRATVHEALSLAVPATVVGAGVASRSMSAMIDERKSIHAFYPEEGQRIAADRPAFLKDLEAALHCSFLLGYAQGFRHLKAAADEYKWPLEFARIATTWTGGCIIRADFLKDVAAEFQREPNITSLLTAPYFVSNLVGGVSAVRRVSQGAIGAGIPCPGMTAALSYFDTMRSVDLPVNLLQLERDLFGAHTFERKDKPRGQFFRGPWAEDEAA